MLLTKEEQKQFAALVNAVIDIPLVPEELEQIIFEFALSAVDSALEEVLPPPFQELMRDPSRGIDKDQAREFSDRLAEAVNRKIDLPYLTEDQETQMLMIVINPIVKAMTHGKSLEMLLPVTQTP
jgi:hypothetical protein